jgi:hypothetical protein
MSSQERKGGSERRGWATYRHGEESKRARIKAGFIVERVYCTGVTPAWSPVRGEDD